MTKPAVCRPAAFDFFRQQLPHLNSTTGLLRAAIGVSMHALDDVSPVATEERLREIAEQVRQRVPSRNPSALLAHMHEVLFSPDEWGFHGNEADYYNPMNSYVPAVLETRLGIPNTLSLIYKFVGERVGLTVEGLNTPRHFLVRVREASGSMIVDPFHAGRPLQRNEAIAMIARATDRPTAHAGRYLRVASHRQWIGRLLLNLQHLFAANDCQHDLAAMTELQDVLRENRPV